MMELQGQEMETDFPLSKRKGLILLLALCLLFAGGAVFFSLRATQARVGTAFILQILAALGLFILLLLLIYRVYVLSTTNYSLRRDGLTIRWGLRCEDIPIGSIEWVRPVNELGFYLSLPWLRLPGLIFGKRNTEGLGLVEFIASNADTMLLVAMRERVFAISPKDGRLFMSTYQRINEMGSLEPIAAQSVYPAFLLVRVWADIKARSLLLIGFCLLLALFGFVSLVIPGRESIVWIGQETAPAERLLLLPILNALIWLGDVLTGLFIYRRGEAHQLPAYFLWAASCITGILLCSGVFFLIY